MSVKAVVLAGGRGKRLASEPGDLPKVLREAGGRPLLSYVLDSLSFIPREDIIIIVGYGRGSVTARFPGYRYAVQESQRGTGHAVLCAAPLLSGFGGTVLVTCGDMPLVARATFGALLDAHRAGGNAATVLADLRPPEETELPPFGRVVRGGDGGFARIVEARDLTAPEDCASRELNTGVYAFDARSLLAALPAIGSANSQGEIYLTDAPAIILASGGRVGVVSRALGDETLGVNTPEDLAVVDTLLRERGSLT
ncbi:MAG: NTP transferase domain-containing protein [Oscillospiraceae bacterium]|jgi:bifunctional N-acetylglucosamine-1-phosphate-uridyltransferase/glucosamine-1-phosphate-acetyltransferase GlmU-like protein|nr:NTP transferase domain-containing protein [Oscillospiraceae bacterium]